MEGKQINPSDQDKTPEEKPIIIISNRDDYEEFLEVPIIWKAPSPAPFDVPTAMEGKQINPSDQDKTLEDNSKITITNRDAYEEFLEVPIIWKAPSPAPFDSNQNSEEINPVKIKSPSPETISEEPMQNQVALSNRTEGGYNFRPRKMDKVRRSSMEATQRDKPRISSRRLTFPEAKKPHKDSY